MVWATNPFHPYVFGNSFTLITDHEPLKWLMTTQKLYEKMARWNTPSRELLQENAFTLQHRAGTDNANDDCLSRYPLLSDADALVLDWSKGEVLPVTVYLAFMVGTLARALPKDEVKEIWEDREGLRFLQTHKYGARLSAKERDRIYKTAKNYR